MSARKAHKQYITNLEPVRDAVEQMSPYHYYQDRYWKLRGHWRTELFEWTRRTPCDVTAELDKSHFIAGTTNSLTVTYLIGETSLIAGARVALYFPMFLGGAEHLRELAIFQGTDGQPGYGSRITAKTSRKDTLLRLNVHSVGSVFTCVEVLLEEGGLEKGESLKIVIGDTTCCRPPVISEKAQTLTFRTAVDFEGDGEFKPVKPDLLLKGRGNIAKGISCYAPATPMPGEEFKLKVIATDIHNDNPSYDYSANLKITSKGSPVDGESDFTATEASHGTFSIDGFSIKSTDGVSRITVMDEENALMGVSNPICPGAAPEGMTLYYGEIHAHTELSDGVGSPEDAMRWARDVEGLDFSAIADHFERTQSYNATREEKWKINLDIVNKYNVPNHFVALVGYEIGTVEAHRNVYFPDDQGRMIVNDDNGEKVTMDNVYDKLEGTDYILIPHAPKFHGVNWHALHKPGRQRLVEICSAWGISEDGGPLSVRTGLDLGLKLGFTGGTDNHSAEPGHAFYAGFGGLTGIYAKELTRKGIFEALMARGTFATNGPRMIMRFSVNETMMGEEHAFKSNTEIIVKGRCITSSAIKSVDIVRNGEVVHSINPERNSDDLTIEWSDPESPERNFIKRELTGEETLYYYLRVHTVDDKFGWASPVWINR